MLCCMACCMTYCAACSIACRMACCIACHVAFGMARAMFCGVSCGVSHGVPHGMLWHVAIAFHMVSRVVCGVDMSCSVLHFHGRWSMACYMAYGVSCGLGCGV